ncbi:MAG: glycosyltransferase, partial [Caulobacteraceae bacterium]|nr:glycosyltransferase [Caulobacteraceae bacterium]
TMEAFAAGKPLLATTDSGGLLEIVSEATGAVAEPEAQALADAIGVLCEPKAARQRGAAAKALWHARGLTWDATLERLLS